MARSIRFRERWNAREISALSAYFNRVVFWPRPYPDSSPLTDLVAAKERVELLRPEELADYSGEQSERTLLVMNGTFNFHLDIQKLLQDARPKLSRHSRILVVAYNSYFHWLYSLATKLGLREGPLPVTYVTRTDVENLASLAGYKVVKLRPTCHCPWQLLGIGVILNRLLPAIPFFRWMGFSSLILLRPEAPSTEKLRLSVVVPVRNERGNLENCLQRMPEIGPSPVEVVFVEGGSTDGSWEEIQRLRKEFAHRFSILALQQKGKGKCDAVRLGMENCSGELVAILDADLTVPPELLPRFYDAFLLGKGDFINGSRLLYPFEGGAMRFLNRLGNGFFAKALSYVLDVRISDALCGTKLFARCDYQRMASWRLAFGDFDPFGDFELLFPAALFGLGIVDIPVQYRARTYGNTSIRRFRDGLVLLRMTLTGLFRIKMGGHP